MSRPGLGSASRSVGVILSESLPSVDLGFSICKSFISGRRRVEGPALVGGPGAGEQVRTQAQHQFPCLAASPETGPVWLTGGPAEGAESAGAALWPRGDAVVGWVLGLQQSQSFRWDSF